MRTTTSKFVTSLDVVVVVTACTIGVGYGILGRRYTQFVNDKFSKVTQTVEMIIVKWLRIITEKPSCFKADELLSQFDSRNSAKEKRRDQIMLVSVYLFITGLICRYLNYLLPTIVCNFLLLISVKTKAMDIVSRIEILERTKDAEAMKIAGR